MKDDKKTIHILMGLPASGKSYWTKHYSKGKNHVNNVSLDTPANKYEKLAERLPRTIQSFAQNKSYYHGYKSDLILDGLFLTQEDIVKVLETTNSYTIDDIKIHFWREDRELCLFNDIGRRSLSSEITIKNASFEKPNIIELNKLYQQTITLEEHTIMRKTDYEAFKEQHSLEDIIASNEWSNGGVYGNCWDDSMSTSSADTPLEFIELDETLEEIEPNLTFLQYKKIKRLATVDSRTDRGYYGSSEEYSWWTINTKELYDLLLELTIIKENK